MENEIVDIIPKRNHKEKEINIIRTLLCTLLSFLLSLAFLALAFLTVIQWSCFNKNTFYHNLVSSKYYENIQADINAKAEDITLPTGLSLEVLKGTTDLSIIEQDINAYIEASFRGEVYVADTGLMENKLEQNIDQYLRSVGIKPDQEQKNNIADYVTTIAEEYKDATQMPLLNYLISARDIYRTIFPIGIVTCIVIAGIIIVMLIKMNARLPITLQYVVFSTIAAALMLAIAPAAALLSGFYKRIQLSPQYYYNFAVIFITNILHALLLFSLSLAAVSIVIIITMRKRKLKIIMNR
jgi:hypothetical protein